MPLLNPCSDEPYKPQALLPDAAFMLAATTLALEKAKATLEEPPVGGFDIHEFVRNLAAFLSGQREGEDEDSVTPDTGYLEWSLIGRMALRTNRRVPTVEVM